MPGLVRQAGIAGSGEYRVVAKVFLPSKEQEVLTVGIAKMMGSKGGEWDLLAVAGFVSIIVPLIVFFSLQRFLVRGLLSGSVK